MNSVLLTLAWPSPSSVFCVHGLDFKKDVSQKALSLSLCLHLIAVDRLITFSPEIIIIAQFPLAFRVFFLGSSDRFLGLGENVY